jgi:hypothetical protein
VAGKSRPGEAGLGMARNGLERTGKAGEERPGWPVASMHVLASCGE